MVFLVGVDHIIQHNGFSWPKKESAINEFSEYLESKVQELKVAVIAEEFSDETLRINNVPMSTAQMVAQRLGLKHVLCDPDSKERKARGISNDDERENIWIERLSDAIDETILFICGDSHLESFKDKLLSRGVATEIISRGWGTELI